MVAALKCGVPRDLASWWLIAKRGREQLAKAVLLQKPKESPNPPEEQMMISLDQVKVTPRDQEVLNLLVQGCSNKEIAGQLNISPRTVKQHLRTLFLRAGIREGRKRVKLAIAIFAREGAQS
jgi:DNA-binding NarL/FixJ family response regulator